MVFKRREQLTVWQRFRDFFYPRAGYRRTIEYLGHRIKRLPDTPHKIALGFSCGVFVSFSPLFGLHFIYAGLCALLVRGNVLAAFIGTFVGNPLTFPLIATTSLSAGRWMFGMNGSEKDFVSVKDAFFEAFGGLWQSFLSIFGMGQASFDKLGVFWSEVFVPYYVGGLGPGLIAAAIFYFLTKPLIMAYQARRRTRLMERAKQKLMQGKAAQMLNEGS